jgi:hypothetical protein
MHLKPLHQKDGVRAVLAVKSARCYQARGISQSNKADSTPHTGVARKSFIDNDSNGLTAPDPKKSSPIGLLPVGRQIAVNAGGSLERVVHHFDH